MYGPLPTSASIATIISKVLVHERSTQGVNGTPTFFVNGLRHDGSYERDELRAAIAHAAR
jgi:protein-disulfide isomerase